MYKFEPAEICLDFDKAWLQHSFEEGSRSRASGTQIENMATLNPPRSAFTLDRLPWRATFDEHVFGRPAARVVFTSISPPLSLRELVGLGDMLRNDPSFDPTFDELLDVSPGCGADFHYADLKAATSADPFSKCSRRAIVVHANVDYGVARMYELLHGGDIQVFRCVEKAREFLQLESK